MHLQERLLRPAVRQALPEGVLRRGLQAGELHQCTLATYCVKSRNLIPGVPAVHLWLRHLRLPDGAVRVRARLHRLLLRRALPQGHLRQEVPRKVRMQGTGISSEIRTKLCDVVLGMENFYRTAVITG